MAESGSVWLVGAGPGAPDLITVRGLDLLRRADVVVYDRLVARELLEQTRADAELIFVGKEPKSTPVSQQRINSLLVDRARRGHLVVWLKGGDPYVFGRGGEEAAALAEAGIAVDLVSGITSAVAVPAAAGIPVSHRDHASSFAVVAAHRAGDRDLPWRSLAGIDTVVILMGAERIRAVCHQLVAAGRDPATPAAAIEWGTTPRQRTLFRTLQNLPESFEAAGFGAHSVIVIGDVVCLASLISSRSRLDVPAGAIA